MVQIRSLQDTTVASWVFQQQMYWSEWTVAALRSFLQANWWVMAWNTHWGLSEVKIKGEFRTTCEKLSDWIKELHYRVYLKLDRQEFITKVTILNWDRWFPMYGRGHHPLATRSQLCDAHWSSLARTARLPVVMASYCLLKPLHHSRTWSRGIAKGGYRG